MSDRASGKSKKSEKEPKETLCGCASVARTWLSTFARLVNLLVESVTCTTPTRSQSGKAVTDLGRSGNIMNAITPEFKPGTYTKSF